MSATAIGLCLFQQYFFPELSRNDPWFFRIFYLILAIVSAVAGFYVFINFRVRGEFVCTLDDEHLECISPVPLCGQSFRVAICDIVKVEKKPSGDSSHTWYLYNREGRRFWLTENYGNPAGAFVALIKERNPAIEEVECQ